MRGPKHGYRGTLRERFDAKWIPEPNTGCWLWIGGTSVRGYGRIEDGGVVGPASHVALRLYAGICPVPGIDVCHRCDTPACVNPDHLFLGTRKQNMIDASKKGRVARGTGISQAKLDPDKVRTIRASTLPTKELSAQFGVVVSVIHWIRSGKGWRHVA